MIRIGAGVCLIFMFVVNRSGAEAVKSDSTFNKPAAPATAANKASGNKQMCAGCHANNKSRIVISGRGNSKPPLWDPLAVARVAGVQNQPAKSLPAAANPKASSGNASWKTKSISGPLVSEATSTETHSSDTMGDHPVDIIYDAAKSEMLALPVKNPDPTSSVKTGFLTPNGIFLPLFDGKIQCETCHDFHDESLAPMYLRDNSTADVLCLTCHTL